MEENANGVGFSNEIEWTSDKTNEVNEYGLSQLDISVITNSETDESSNDALVDAIDRFVQHCTPNYAYGIEHFIRAATIHPRESDHLIVSGCLKTKRTPR